MGNIVIVLAWRHAVLIPECPEKVGVIAEPSLLVDFGDWDVLQDQLLGPDQLFLDDVPVQGRPGLVLELTAQMEFTEEKDLSQVINLDFFLNVLANVFNHRVNQAVFAHLDFRSLFDQVDFFIQEEQDLEQVGSGIQVLAKAEVIFQVEQFVEQASEVLLLVNIRPDDVAMLGTFEAQGQVTLLRRQFLEKIPVEPEDNPLVRFVEIMDDRLVQLAGIHQDDVTGLEIVVAALDLGGDSTLDQEIDFKKIMVVQMDAGHAPVKIMIDLIITAHHMLTGLESLPAVFHLKAPALLPALLNDSISASQQQLIKF